MTHHVHDPAHTHEPGYVHDASHAHEPHVHEPAVAPAHTHDRGPDMTGYAAIKYTALVIIVLAVLWFLAVYVLPRLG